MVDPKMAQATAVHTKIATIAIIRFNMVVCVSTLSAATPTYLARLALSSTFHYKVKASGTRPSKYRRAHDFCRAPNSEKSYRLQSLPTASYNPRSRSRDVHEALVR